MKKYYNVYPHPQFKRDSFYSLNGEWLLNDKPINVPYPKESKLSDYPIKTHEDNLIYIKEFKLPNNFYSDKDDVILHFEAVDQICKVYLNDDYLGEHIGGYLPFKFNISDYLKDNNILRLEVKDDIDLNIPYGKQTNNPKGMWYTPVSGIWKSVWLEAIPKENRIEYIKIDTTINTISMHVETNTNYRLVIKFDEEYFYEDYTSKDININLDEIGVHYSNWSPDNPVLYEFSIGTDTDLIESYLAIREIKVKRVGKYLRTFLNDKPIYINALLDQGYFEDGIYLPDNPSKYLEDINNMKGLGFNALRKHIKVEDEEFYYYCDKVGMLVIQDMVNSGEVNFLNNILLPTIGIQHRKDDKNVNEDRFDFFIKHSKETIRHLYNHPCIISWTIYNESWGQQKANVAYKLLKKEDEYRLFDTCSGWYKDYLSDIDSYHIYFRNKVLKTKNYDKVLMLSEFGGIKREIKDHIFKDRPCNYGYGASSSEEELTNKMEEEYKKMLIPSIHNGLCGSVFTQVSDVEEEINGLYTYDREVCKVNKKRIKELNKLLYDTYNKECEE